MNGRRSRVAAVLLALVLLPAIPARSASPITAAEAIALVKASPELKIDTREQAPSGFPPATHPAIDVPGSDGSAGYLSAEYAKEGTLSDGSTALAIPLDSDGSGGIFNQLIFVRAKGASTFAFAGNIGSDGHLDVSFVKGAIVARMPLYVASEPECCPSTFRVETYDIVGGKLHERSTEKIPAPQSTPQRR